MRGFLLFRPTEPRCVVSCCLESDSVTNSTLTLMLHMCVLVWCGAWVGQRGGWAKLWAYRHEVQCLAQNLHRSAWTKSMARTSRTRAHEHAFSAWTGTSLLSTSLPTAIPTSSTIPTRAPSKCRRGCCLLYCFRVRVTRCGEVA